MKNRTREDGTPLCDKVEKGYESTNRIVNDGTALRDKVQKD